MNKLTKLMLASALLATSGFSTTVEINTDRTYPVGFTASMEDGTSYVLANGVTLHNYITIQGPTTGGESAAINLADGATSATIKNYTDQIEKDESFAKYNGISGDYYRTIGEGKIAGNVTFADGITVESVAANAYDTMSELSGGPHTIVFAGSDEDVTMKHEGSTAFAIAHNIANDIGTNTGLGSKNLKLTGKYELSGDNSHFNAEGTSVTLENAEVDFKGAKSVFNSDINIGSGSKATISAGTEYSKTMKLSGGRLVLNSSSFTFTPDSSLILEKAPVVLTHKLTLDPKPGSTDVYLVWDTGVYDGSEPNALSYMKSCLMVVGVSLNADRTAFIRITKESEDSKSDGKLNYDSTNGILDYSGLEPVKTDDVTTVDAVMSGTGWSYKKLYDFLSFVELNPAKCLGELPSIG